ncbi:hypothetical protein EFY79_14970 [Hanamia caeni]|uniref:Uncharacterized protein n=1 Tax=Hanamia caeni TaxID=2294116 RepID=A0A3M9N9J6_9BACT|nr:hypothetical protein [Hanamia caeni]RNI34482.1 hypothetical protein EFY79_14970 [Hanamia caeni]
MKPTKPSEIKALQILYTALLVGQVLFLIITSVIILSGNFSTDFSLGKYLIQIIIVCVVIGLAGYFAGASIFRKKLEQLNNSPKSLMEKFNDYRGVSITRWALSEFATLFSIIMVFVTGAAELLVVAIFLIGLFLTIRPSLSKAASDLHVSEMEIEQMDSKSTS